MVKRLLACALLAGSLFSADPARAAADPLKNPSPEYIAALREAVRAFNERDFAALVEEVER